MQYRKERPEMKCKSIPDISRFHVTRKTIKLFRRKGNNIKSLGVKKNILIYRKKMLQIKCFKIKHIKVKHTVLSRPMSKTKRQSIN